MRTAVGRDPNGGAVPANFSSCCEKVQAEIGYTGADFR